MIFDIGNVLIDFDWLKCLNQFSYNQETRDVLAQAMFLNEDWIEGDRGASAEEWLALFIGNAPEHESEIRAVYEKLDFCINEKPYTRKLIQHYRTKGYKIYYLSNYSGYLRELSKGELSFLDEFDGGVFSYEEKCIKPQEEIYKRLFKRYNVVPGESLFFDDVPENIQTARRLGLHGVVFTPETVKKILG